MDDHGRSVSSSPTPRLWPADAWQALATRILGMTHGGGGADFHFATEWGGNVRWARNRVSTSGDRRNNTLTIGRNIHGAGQSMTLNQLDDGTIRVALAYIESLIQRYRSEALEEYTELPFRAEDYLHPTLWFAATDQLDGTQRATLVEQAIAPIEAAGMLSAGYLEVKASGTAVIRPGPQVNLYYSVTRGPIQPDGARSGRNGVGVGRGQLERLGAGLDVEGILSAVALEKCLTSRNPVAVEPGTVHRDLWSRKPCMTWRAVVILLLPFITGFLDPDDSGHEGPQGIQTRLRQRFIDGRLTVRADPMDPDLGFVPFDTNSGESLPSLCGSGLIMDCRRPSPMTVSLPSPKWTRQYWPIGRSANFRIDWEGQPSSVEEMIFATTKRGPWVTRFYDIESIGNSAFPFLMVGYTRDGLWLVENGKISKPVKNFRWIDDLWVTFNQVEQGGVSQRVFCPGTAALVPPLKVRDFSFTSLSDDGLMYTSGTARMTTRRQSRQHPHGVLSHEGAPRRLKPYPAHCAVRWARGGLIRAWCWRFLFDTRFNSQSNWSRSAACGTLPGWLPPRPRSAIRPPLIVC